MKKTSLGLLAIVLAFAGCGSSSAGAGDPSHDAGASDAGQAAHDSSPGKDAQPATQYSISANIALSKDPDGDHVSFATQNGSTVSFAVSDLVGKRVYWATTLGGEAIANATPIDKSISALSADLTATFTTPAHYKDGPYEVYCVISLTGSTTPPSPGDLAAFNNAPPRKGDPPDTGESVRVDVDGSNAKLTLDNSEFIQFGSP
jgi:hypothetical protein